MNDEICQGCNHPIGRHVKCVDEKVRCFVVESGMSTGVIMHYTQECDCLDYRSQRVEDRIAKEKREKDEWQKDFDERFKDIKKIMSVDELLS